MHVQIGVGINLVVNVGAQVNKNPRNLKFRERFQGPRFRGRFQGPREVPGSKVSGHLKRFSA